MKPSTIPMICCMAMTAMLAAGTSHWWSVRQFSHALQNGMPIVPAVSPSTTPLSNAPPATMAQSQQERAPSMASIRDADMTGQKKFYEALIEKMASVENQNRDLLDQLAETNRDLMKLEFRIDTHSESFRPLPLVEEQPYSNIDNGAGVLPPRSSSISLPSYE